MGKRGPQPLPENLLRRYNVGTRLNDDELDELEERLAAPGLAALVRSGAKERSGFKLISELVRARVLGKRIRLKVPEVNRQLAADLGRLGSNVNQISASINAKSLDIADRDVLRLVIAEIKEVQDVLRGVTAASISLDEAEFECADELVGFD
jgi:hypothetical protein